MVQSKFTDAIIFMKTDLMIVNRSKEEILRYRYFNRLEIGNYAGFRVPYKQLLRMKIPLMTLNMVY